MGCLKRGNGTEIKMRTSAEMNFLLHFPVGLIIYQPYSNIMEISSGDTAIAIPLLEKKMSFRPILVFECSEIPPLNYKLLYFSYKTSIGTMHRRGWSNIFCSNMNDSDSVMGNKINYWNFSWRKADTSLPFIKGRVKMVHIDVIQKLHNMPPIATMINIDNIEGSYKPSTSLAISLEHGAQLICKNIIVGNNNTI